VGEPQDVDATVRRIECLVEELGQADPQLRRRAEELISLLMQLYQAGFSRAVEILGREHTSRIAEDKLVGSLLLLHGLHPADATERIAGALRRVERRLDGHRLHLIGIADEVAHIRVEVNGGAVPPSLAGAIERAVVESAPDIARVEIEGVPQAAIALVQIAASVSPPL
jgi:hypothetical protein